MSEEETDRVKWDVTATVTTFSLCRVPRLEPITFAVTLGPPLYLYTSSMDQTAAKKALQDLVKNDNHNRICADCLNPNPQWASLG
jgi:hypothetical protein